MIDLHSHILPGFDDGSESLTESLKMAKVYVEAGYTQVVATPHVIPFCYEHTRQEIIEGVQNLQAAIKAEGIALEVLPAAEYYLTADLPDNLSKGEILTINDNGKYLLVELPVEEVPFYTSQVLFDLRLAGVTPVVVHPERNTALATHPDLVTKMLQKGILFQVTAGCVTGLFGHTARRVACSFIKNKWVQFIATDAHNSGRRLRAGAEVAQILGIKSRPLMSNNPAAVVSGSALNAAIGADINKNRSNWLRDIFNHLKPINGHSNLS